MTLTTLGQAFLHLVADDPKLDAQVPTEIPFGEGERHPEAALLNIQDLRLQGDRVHSGHRLPERKGELS